MEFVNSILEIVDDNKQNMPDNDYLNICKNLSEINKVSEKFFRCVFLYPYIKKENINKSHIYYKKKVSIVNLNLDEYEVINSVLLFNECVFTYSHNCNHAVEKLFQQLEFHNKYEFITQYCNTDDLYCGIHKLKMYPIILNLSIF